MRIRSSLHFGAAIVAACLLVPSATAELPQRYQEWAEGPIQHLFTKADKDAWSALADEAAAENFIRLFWAQRDPTPESAENEYQREFERRVAYADQQFAHKKDDETVRGSLTDRGRIFVMLGAPRRLQQPGAGGSTSGGALGGDSAFGGGGGVASGGGGGRFGRGGTTDRFGVASEEVWVYEGDEKPEVIKKKRLRVKFRTKPGTEEVQIHQGEEALALAAEAADRAVLHPTMTVADLSTAPAPSALGGEAMDSDYQAWGASTLSDPAALESLRAALTGDAESSFSAHLDAAPFLAGDGTTIIPVQIATTGEPPADAVVVGELVDAAGESAVSFEIDSDWKNARDQKLRKTTVVAPPGAYELRTGLKGSDGAILWSASEAIEIPAISDELWLSDLIVSDNIFPMKEAQAMLEPFAWQGIVVVPKGDRTFEQEGVLWYYLHTCHPALADNNLPNLRLTVELDGAAKFRGPAAADPVKAGDDCWVLAQGLELTADRFPAGDYEMKVYVRDSEARKTVTSSTETFSVVVP
ncbi:MAG: GWxTD domain-containing protein [Acidobacteriota bacterium]